MTSSRKTQVALDVAVVVDATMEQGYLDEVARFLNSLREPTRLAIVAFGDHDSCVGTVAVGSNLYDIRTSPFSERLHVQRGWFEEHVTHVPLVFCDAALECALKAAADLDWREDAAKRVLILGWSLPHHSPFPVDGVPVRTGVACPAGQCWKTHLGRLAALRNVRVVAACPPAIMPRWDGSSFMELLRETVWQHVSLNGRLDVLDAGLGSRWRELFAA